MSVFYDCNGIKLQVNKKKKTTRKSPNTWKLNNTLLKNLWVKEDVSKEINKYIELDFPGGAVVKNPPANAGDTGLSSGLGRSHMPWSN